MKRFEIINRLIKFHNFSDYLEIGVRDGECFKEIICKNKTGVDPSPVSDHTTHKMTSDEFFESCDANKKFDLIFIDGLHLDFQVDNDIINSLNFLKEGGLILLHDCNPPTQYHALEMPVLNEITKGDWNGTVYKSLVKLRLYRNNLKLRTVDTDWGVGILSREKSECLNVFPSEATTWEFFNVNRQHVLNLMSIDEFLNLYKI